MIAMEKGRSGHIVALALGILIIAALLWPKSNGWWGDGAVAELQGKSDYENMVCSCVGLAMPADDCRSCVRHSDCYGIPLSCHMVCFKKVDGAWREVSCISNASAQSYPTDEASCAARGGAWGPIGLFPDPVCVLPTTDAGKKCMDSSECESTCVAELSAADYEKVVKFHIPVYTSGTCSAYYSGVGCHAYVENGVVGQVLCVD
ncbi:Uncharacterised protein [uncultured archaeon]|nr:Uncharacterised protein [uncultured archaeon]